jgi:3-oxoacyl-[acyl-carrier protein] reductase
MSASWPTEQCKDEKEMKTNSVAMVTGAGSGIGKAVAMTLARAGYALVLNDVVQKAGEQTLQEIQGAGGKALFLQADVSDVTQVRRMFEEAKRQFDRIDVLVNNAGVPGAFSLLVDMPDETWHKTITVHLNGTFYCLREAARLMLASGFGRIVNIASIAGIMGTPGSGEYGAAKAGIINLTKTAAKELGPYNITVNAIAPGMVGTPTNLKLKEKGSPFIQTAIEGTPTGRMTTPEEIADLIVFLSSAGAGNINGQVICVDGGAEMSISMDRFMIGFLAKKSATLKGKTPSVKPESGKAE